MTQVKLKKVVKRMSKYLGDPTAIAYAISSPREDF
jgi:hypothetical protein